MGAAMTTFLDRLNGTDVEPEGTSMPFPESLPAVPGTSAIPWWTGSIGVDPDVRYKDWRYAAECAAIACAVHVLGLDAGRADWWQGQMKAPVRKWAEWLAADQEQAPKRTMTLRLVCERSAVIHPDHILGVAQKLCDAGTLR